MRGIMPDIVCIVRSNGSALTLQRQALRWFNRDYRSGFLWGGPFDTSIWDASL